MAFNTSSYCAGVGTVFAAIALGFGVGAMMTTGSGIQPPNRVERVASSASLPSSTPGQVDAPKPAPQEQPAPAAVVPAQASDPAPVVQGQPKPAPAAMAKSEDAATPNAQQPPPAQTQTMARSENAATPRDEHAAVRAAELKREAYRKRAEERKLAERKRRREIDDAANAVRQMRRDGVRDGMIDEVVVEREERPRFGFFGDN